MCGEPAWGTIKIPCNPRARRPDEYDERFGYQSPMVFGQFVVTLCDPCGKALLRAIEVSKL